MDVRTMYGRREILTSGNGSASESGQWEERRLDDGFGGTGRRRNQIAATETPVGPAMLIGNHEESETEMHTHRSDHQNSDIDLAESFASRSRTSGTAIGSYKEHDYMVRSRYESGPSTCEYDLGYLSLDSGFLVCRKLIPFPPLFSLFRAFTF